MIVKKHGIPRKRYAVFCFAKNVIFAEILIKRVVVGADPYGEN